MSHIEQIGIRELRQNASAYLRRVAAGEVIEVTDRGRPVARLVPVRSAGFDRLVAEGRVRRARGDLLSLWPPLPSKKGQPLASELVSRARDE